MYSVSDVFSGAHAVHFLILILLNFVSRIFPSSSSAFTRDALKDELSQSSRVCDVRRRLCVRASVFFLPARHLFTLLYVYFEINTDENETTSTKPNPIRMQIHDISFSSVFRLTMKMAFFSVEKWIELYVASRVLREFENKPTKKNNKQINILNSVDCHETNERRRANNSRDSYFRNGVCVCGDTQHCHLRLIH